MKFFEAAVNKPVAVTMRLAAMVVLGAICFTRLPIDLLPKVSMPIIAVSTAWPNVGPEEMEYSITRKVEQAVSSVPNLYSVSSSTSQGNSRVTIQFQWGTDIGQAAVDVLQLVQRARQGFPNDDTIQAPVVFKFDPATQPILMFGVSGVADSVKLRAIVDNEVAPMVESADGVAAATVAGGDARAIIVDVDPHKLQAYGVSIAEIGRRLAQENVNLPAGVARMGNTEYTIRSVGNFKSPEEAAALPLGVFGGHLVSLGEVAKVSDSHLETRILTRLDGQPCVGMTITKQTGANTIATAEAVMEKLDQAKKLYPELNFKLAYDQSRFIAQSIEDLKTSAIVGGSLAVLVLMFFLRNVRSTLVVALSIPISVIATFALMFFCEFSLNTISLSGLALATGLIVDDAVVVLENIFRHIQRDGKSPREAAVTGSQEIASAVVSSTFTVMIVFLPLLLVRGQSGQVFGQFALVVIFSIAVSLFVATTAVPMLASRLIREDELHDHTENGTRQGRISLLTRAFDWSGRQFAALDASYRRGLSASLNRKWRVICIAGAISLGSIPIAKLVGYEMMPPTDSGDLNVDVRLPVGTALRKTNEAMLKVEEIVRKNPNVLTVFSAAGTSVGTRGVGGRSVPSRGSATVKLKDGRTKATADVVKELQRQLVGIPGIRVTVSPTDMTTQILTGGNTNMQVDVFCQDLPTLTATAKEVMQSLRGISGLENVDLNVQDTNPELQWRTDRQKALTLGVSFQDIASTINAATSGSLAGFYQEKGYQYPIYVEVEPSLRRSAEQLLNLPVTPSVRNGAASGQILLRQVAQPVFAMGPTEINRLDRQRLITVSGRVQDRSEGEVQADVREAMAKFPMPAGAYWDYGLQQRRRAEEYAGMGLAVLLAIGLIYMLLATQFESFVYPLVVLTSVPLCAIGVVLGLFLTGRTFGLTAYIGILMLVGIVVKNGILLVDYTNQLRARGLSRTDAILRAGPTRLRPILMTTSAAVLGMLPLAIGLGRGTETQAPLATAVIGGLITSTVLTLFVVPVVYVLFDDLSQRLRTARQSKEEAPNGG